MSREVWLISEGSPGHTSQSEGLAAALARRVELRKTMVETRPRLGGVTRNLVRHWMGPAGRPLPWFTLSRLLRCQPPAGVPDLLIASGGKSVFAARSLAATLKVPLVFSGERKPYPSSWFHTVLTPSPMETGENDLQVDLIPTKFDVDSARCAAEAWIGKPTGPLWTMVIGGRSVSHHFQDGDWKDLASSMNRLAEAEGIRWLVSTSRRTGAEAEAILRRTLDPAHVADAIWWSENPRKGLASFLGAAATVVVTQDSVTMVTEALACGKPVVLAAPREVRFPQNSFLPGYFERLEQRAYLIRRAVSELATLRGPDLAPAPPAGREIERTVDALLERLGWNA